MLSQVFIDTSGPEFIGWDDINGIDEVKQEIEEIIDYLKNPALLRLRGVNRIGGVLLAGAPGTGKTLLAKAIAAESGVKMFTCSGVLVACCCGAWTALPSGRLMLRSATRFDLDILQLSQL